MRLFALSLFSVFLLAGCGFTSSHYVITGTAGAPRGGDVRIVLEAAPIPPHLEEVAIVQSVGHGTEADLEHILEALKEQARQLGCDNVVRVHIDQGAGTASASGVAARTRAVAPPPAAVAPPPAPAAPPPVAAPAPPAAS